MSNDIHLDLAAVDRYLSANLSGYEGPLEATKFSVGQSNPTFELRTPGKTYVLRRKPPGVLLKSAHAVDREFRVQSALAGSQVPVPMMFLLCEDDSVIGSAFYVMERLHGRIFPEPTLQGETNETRAAVMNEMNRVLAQLHMVDIDAVGLSDYGPTGNYYERQISRWTKQYRASETSVIEDMDALASELENSVQQDDGQRTLVHGDYRIDNLMFAAESADCIGVLDWELSTIGHPYADLAAVIMQWQLPPGKQGRGLAGVDRGNLGLPSDQAFVAQYCKRRGLDGIENFGFYLAFNFFRMAGILQGVYKRALDGNASDPERAKAYGAYVPLFAQHGLKALHGTFT
ncbi:MULTISPECIES: phosphotransferase [unclassified Ruegeria]|uniref:phosphotransferase n=1 Tax=unclassified Ruegeria TaxID=2625375 RepID=UPI001490BD0D|nr:MULTISPECIES: phosphotransferase [unclassified Ruegeria]NOD46251.1 phosphotransferase [Ruegeria sp. HKCCD5849]NOD50449.1 phosphotransferase [Ruegeria sp. HKCCD5851]NOD67265.1 phosphotransferase [Ruegeria sp. HKCCD7303]